MNHQQFIYTIPNSIPDETCHEIIVMFENEQTNPGVIHSGLNKLVKDTDDFVIPKNSHKWNNIRQMLENELEKNVNKYFKKLTINIFTQNDYDFMNNTNSWISVLMIQRYIKNQGKYVYHNDFSLNNDKSYRIITYLWYLNDVEEGGETEFWDGEFKIKPEKGKLLLFPSTWTFPHSGKMPISSNKYIITGWLYVNFD